MDPIERVDAILVEVEGRGLPEDSADLVLSGAVVFERAYHRWDIKLAIGPFDRRSPMPDQR